VEKFRKDALNLQEKKDYLLMSMDLIKSNEMLQTMSEGKHNVVNLSFISFKCDLFVIYRGTRGDHAVYSACKLTSGYS